MKLPTLLAVILFAIMPPMVDDPYASEPGYDDSQQLQLEQRPIYATQPGELAPQSVQTVPPLRQMPSATNMPVDENMQRIDRFQGEVPEAPPTPYLTPLPQQAEEQPPATEQEEAPVPEEQQQPAQATAPAAPGTAAPVAPVPPPPRLGPTASPEALALQAQLDAQQKQLAKAQEQLGIQQQQLAVTQQQLGTTQQELEDTQAQIPPLQEQAQAGAETSSALLNRGQEVAQAAAARADTLSQSASQLEAINYAAGSGDADFGGAVGQLESVLDSSSAAAQQAGNVQEAEAADRAHDYLEQARRQLISSNLFNARVNLGAAVPWVQRAAILAATNPSAPTFGASMPEVTGPAEAAFPESSY